MVEGKMQMKLRQNLLLKQPITQLTLMLMRLVLYFFTFLLFLKQV